MAQMIRPYSPWTTANWVVIHMPAVIGKLKCCFTSPVIRRNIKGRPFWSRVWVVASTPTERSALNE